MAAAQNQPGAEFRKVIIDCHSVGYSATELQPSRKPTSFCIKNIALCILSLMRIYLLTALDGNVFQRYKDSDQKNMLRKVAAILTSHTVSGEQALTDLQSKVKRLNDRSMTEIIGDIRKICHVVLLRQDCHIGVTKECMRNCHLLWKEACLPRIILCWNVDSMHANKINTISATITSDMIIEFVNPFNVYSYEKSNRCTLLIDYSNHFDALILSNDEMPIQRQYEIQEGECDTRRLSFCITRDGAYIYLPKDFQGRNEDTLMQHLIPSVRLSMEFEKAWTEASLEHEKNIQKIRDKIQKMIHAGQTGQKYRYLLVVDFEATCEGKSNSNGYQHEIIEFALVLVDTASGQQEEFQRFCKPRLNHTLTEFCCNLTGIKQSDVDSAPLFPQVLNDAETWLNGKGVLDEQYALATDREADVATFLRMQCEHDSVPVPSWATQWINLRLAFQKHYSLRTGLKLLDMLRVHDLQFQGRQHRGIDDAKNCARVAHKLLEHGCLLLINQCLEASNEHFRCVDTNEAENMTW